MISHAPCTRDPLLHTAHDGDDGDDLARWKETMITTMLVGGPPRHLETVARLVL